MASGERSPCASGKRADRRKRSARAPAPRRKPRGPTSRSPKAAIARARSAPSRRSAEAAVAVTGVDRRRNARPRRQRRRRDRARRAGSRVVRKRRRRGQVTRSVAARSRRARAGRSRVRLRLPVSSEVHDPLVSTMLELPTVVPYFDLSLQHASAPLLRAMKRWGDGDRFLGIIDRIPRNQARRRVPFVVHRRVSRRDGAHREEAARAFLGQAAELDWAGFFAFSREEGTAAGVAHLVRLLRRSSLRTAARAGRDPGAALDGIARRWSTRDDPRCSSTASRTARPSARTYRESARDRRRRAPW